jgi:hypothetical protein
MSQTMLSDAKLLLEITGHEHDAILSLMIPAIMEAADDYMGIRYSGYVTNRVELRNGGKSIYYLDYAGAYALTVEVEDVEVPEEDYVLDSARSIVRFKSGETVKGMGNVRFTYSGGYGDTEIPAPLRRKLLRQVEYEFRRRRDPGLMTVGFPDGSVSKFETGEWLPDVEKELMRRKRYVFSGTTVPAQPSSTGFP